MMIERFKRKFSCLECGIPYECYPPDDVHIQANSVSCKECKKDERTIKESQEEVPANYECDNCSKLNKIFWHDPSKHVKFVRRGIVIPKIMGSSDKVDI